MERFHVCLSQNHMATTFHLTISCEQERIRNADHVLKECQDLIGLLEIELSEFLEESPVYQLNRAPVGETVIFTESGLDLLDASEWISRITQGAFDCTAKSTSLKSSNSSKPCRLGWDRKSRRVWRKDAGVSLGFGAIGKGYALDRVRLLIEQQGFEHYCLSAGGSSIVLSGLSHHNEPWSWGWSWEKDEQGEPMGKILSHPSGSSMALGVSGQQVQKDHLIDPMTGKSSDSAVSALVGHASATWADALSTALFVGGWKKATEWVQEVTPSPALAFLDQQKIPHWNRFFEQTWGKLE